MKKVFIVVLMLVYGLSSSGMTINLHYCCGKLDGISLAGKIEDSCPMHGSMGKDGCCEDKQVVANLTSDLQAAGKWLHAPKLSAPESVPHNVPSSFTFSIKSDHKFPSEKAYPSLSLPLFLKNCVFRI